MLDVPSWAIPQLSVMDALAAVLAPYAEVVLHDLDCDEIVAIRNGFSRRRVGDPSLLSELPSQEAQDGRDLVLGPYEKVTAEGHRLLSVSAVVVDEQGKRRGLLCLNLDQAPVDELRRAVEALGGPHMQSRPAALFERDWREQIALLVDDWCRQQSRPRDQLRRAERLELIRQLDAADLFATRHAAQHAAEALGVSRATVYSLLKNARERGRETEH